MALDTTIFYLHCHREPRDCKVLTLFYYLGGTGVA
jgi:hypothetical protein